MHAWTNMLTESQSTNNTIVILYASQSAQRYTVGRLFEKSKKTALYYIQPPTDLQDVGKCRQHRRTKFAHQQTHTEKNPNPQTPTPVLLHMKGYCCWGCSSPIMPSCRVNRCSTSSSFIVRQKSSHSAGQKTSTNRKRNSSSSSGIVRQKGIYIVFPSSVLLS